MKKLLQSRLAHAALVVVFVGAVQPARASVNLAAGAPEIAESGSWYGNPGSPNDTSPFGGQNITNGGNSTPASQGLLNPGYVPAQEISSGEGSFWLPAQDSRPNIDGVTASYGYVTIDLGSVVHLGEFDLYNTHNGQYHDRATGAFQIDASNTVDGSGNLTGYTTILTGNLSRDNVYGSSGQYIAPDIFQGNFGDYRYLTFIALSAPNTYGAGSPGLNELRAFVPEPASFALLAAGLVGLLVFRRRLAG